MISEKPKVEEILAAIGRGRNFAESWVERPGTGMSTPWPQIATSDLFVLVACIRKMQKQIKSLEKDLEFSCAGYDTVDCTPKEAQPDEEDSNTVSG